MLNARKAKIFLPRLAAILAVLGPVSARAEWGLNFPPPVTLMAEKIYDLHMLIFAICVVIFIGVFGVMFYSAFAHRKSRGHKAARFHEHTQLEVVWTIIPFLILVGMAIPSTARLLEMDDLSGSDITVKITGYQWKWHYDYLDHGVNFFSSLATPPEEIGKPLLSTAGFQRGADRNPHYLLQVDKPLVLPVGKKVRILVTANDVLHAWWVPQLASKKDAIPGYINEIWTRIETPGTYRGQCAELCGQGHGFMPIVVEAVNEDQFKAWVGEQKTMLAAAAAQSDRTFSKGELLEKGKGTYDKVCAACHQPNGQGVPGVFPAIAGSKIATGPLAGHLNIVLNGKPGTLMQAFGAQLNDAELAAVITYQRNAFGNNTGDVVQPVDVKAARK